MGVFIEGVHGDVDVVTFNFAGVGAQAGGAAPEAFAGSQVVAPAVPGAGDFVAFYAASGQIRQFMLAAYFHGTEGAVRFFEDAHGTGEDFVGFAGGVCEVLYFGYAYVFHGLRGGFLMVVGIKCVL